MNKKFLLSIIFTTGLMITNFTIAATNCDNQAKPAFDCPTGYSMMCIPVGGDHWGCGKESNGAIIEASGNTSAEYGQSSGVKSTMQTQVRVEDSNTSTGVSKDSTTTNSSSEKVLPTVNKKTDESSQRLLPTVNKRTTDAKITVRGWNPEKKEAITAKIKTETENNPEINSVDIAEDSVNIDYLVAAKLFGFIPTHMHLNVSADTDMRVKVKFPWYRFLVRSDFSNAPKQLDEVFQNNQTDLEFLKSQDSQERQIEIFLKISNTMHEMSKSIIQNIKA